MAKFVMKGFELVTGMKIADWAADFAANRDVLRKGQKGTMSFALSGRVRAVIRKGVWEADPWQRISFNVFLFKDFGLQTCTIVILILHV